ncbi:amidase signature domain-containing protein [Podospora didyma]|uniref:Amidase signature domain-containing protein n=1 Tax=Podospora didyma TaxID=330526 RepID=A0AAE0NSF0_9PEZI|nr:amidase signature domain-containing protein [Podospora didyma]
MKLNAIISTRPRDGLYAEAAALDAERSTTGPRSRLHGIPIVVKDLICTPSFGMETTSGSLALKGLNASQDSPIATMLKAAGCILIGKSNLSKWANSKGVGVTSGWSAVGGQTQSPYIKDGVDLGEKWIGHSTPGGSSSGSAAAAAAGFAPPCIGTEADGSIVQPAIRAALHATKGAVGNVSMVGTQLGGAAFDSAGPMAKSMEDCADIMEIFLPGRDIRFNQQTLILNLSTTSSIDMRDGEYDNSLRHFCLSMRDGIEKCLAESKSDLIMASGESLLPAIAAAAGYPIAKILARNGEEKMFEVMSA